MNRIIGSAHNLLCLQSNNAIVAYPPAKINLALHVIGQRFDGYHFLESLVTFSQNGDIVRIEKSDCDSFLVDGPFADALCNDNKNLVLRARDALRAATSGKVGPVAIYLTKKLPISSGIGGGSGDAAATLAALALLTPTQLSVENLMHCALSLGADVPMCLVGIIHKSALIVRGIGEKITVFSDFPQLNLVLFNQGPAVSTALVFAKLEKKENPPLVFDRNDMISFNRLVHTLKKTRNDLYTSARQIAPVLDENFKILRKSGAALVRMSGSGAMCFGLYSSAEEAHRAAQYIACYKPNCFVQATTTFGGGRMIS